jgi:peptide deformylase
MKRPLAYYGNPVLRKKASEISVVTAEIRQLVFDMFETMDAYRGIGLAAPQVGQSIRLFVARLIEEDLPYEEWTKQPIEAFINPVLSEPGNSIEFDWEACLSIPAVKGKVERPASIRLQAMDLEGRHIDRVYEGYLARAVMHEVDHLEGILYIDKLSKASRKQIEPKLKEILEKYR